MAPMTRARGEGDGVANDLTVLHYTQRSSVGLIITEGINISKQVLGRPFTPGIYTGDQIAGLRKLTDAVPPLWRKVVVRE